jgi:hypothetical protein
MFRFWVIFSALAYIVAIYDTLKNDKKMIGLLYPLPLFVVIGLMIHYWGW